MTEKYMIEDIEVLFKDMPDISDPGCKYPGLLSGQFVLKKGFTFGKGRRPLPCDIICDSDYQVKLENDSITMYSDIYRPVTDEKIPAIICWGYGGKRDTNLKIENIKKPDGKGNLKPIIDRERLSGFQCWEGLDPAEWVRHGYAIVNADPPGVCDSEGDMLMFGSRDGRHGAEFIEKIAALDWCNGKVAMAGSSWYSMVQFLFAAQKPQHLVAIAPFEAEADMYRDEYVRGGMGLTGKSFSIGFRTHGNKRRIEDIGRMIEIHPLYDGYWKDKLWAYENINIPAYVTGSFTSWFHTRGTVEGFNRLASKDKWLRIHDSTEWIDLYSEYYTNDLRKFFDYYLKNIDNDWKKTPRVRLTVFNPGHEDIKNRPEASYPPAAMEPKTFYLNAETGMMSEEKPERVSVAQYDSDDNGSTVFRYTFDKYVELNGCANLKIWVQAPDHNDMDVFVKYYKVDQDGNRLSSDVGLGRYYGPEGRLRVSHRELDGQKSTILEPVHKHERQLMLENEEIVQIEIPIWPTGLAFNKGETIEVKVSSVDFTEDRPPSMIEIASVNKGRHKIYTGGKYDSCIILPVC